MRDTFDVEYKTSDLAKRLNIAVRTVRKYAEELEKSGYEFERDGTGSRIYRQHDYDSFLLLKGICENTKVGLEQAARMVVSRSEDEVEAASLENRTKSTDIFTDARLKDQAESSEIHILVQELRHAIMQFASTQELIVRELETTRQRENELINEIEELKNQLRIKKEDNHDTPADESQEINSRLQERKKKKLFRFF